MTFVNKYHFFVLICNKHHRSRFPVSNTKKDLLEMERLVLSESCVHCTCLIVLKEITYEYLQIKNS